MIETLSAFTVLMIIMGVLYGIIAFCSELRMQAADAGTVLQEFNIELYNQESADSNVIMRQYNTAGKNNVPLFYISVNTEETLPENLKNNESTDMKQKISLYNICAKTYSYELPKDEEGKEQEARIVFPKVMQFIHKVDWK